MCFIVDRSYGELHDAFIYSYVSNEASVSHQDLNVFYRMNAYGMKQLNISVLVVFIYYLVDSYVTKIDLDITLWVLLLLTPVAVLLCSFYYDTILFNRSWPLFIFSFISGVIGNMQYQTLFPVLTRYMETYTIISRNAGDIAR